MHTREVAWKIGVLLVSEKAKNIWLDKKVETWVAGLKCLVVFERTPPQTAYPGLIIPI